MPNTITSRILNDGARNFVVHVHINSDGTEETALRLYEPSDANPPFTNCKVDKLLYSMAGSFQGLLLWEGSPNKPLFTLVNDIAAEIDNSDRNMVSDPPVDSTGVILLQTTGIGAADELDIVLHLKKRKIKF